MAAIRGNKPMGDPEIVMGQPNGTIGNMWGDVQPAYDITITGRGGMRAFTPEDITEVVEYEIVITGGGTTGVTLEFIYPYAGSPTKAVPVGAVGPTQARLKKP